MPVGIAIPSFSPKPTPAKKATPKTKTIPLGTNARTKDTRSAPAAVPGPAPVSAPVDYGYTDGGVAIGGYSAPAPAVSEADYLAGDTAYNATIAALDAALKMYEADNAAQRKKYDIDYDTSLRTLGRNKAVGTEGSADYKPASWDLTDQTTASGKAYQSQLGDFASRGLLQSSLYDRARGDLMRQLDKQATSIETARTNFMDELDRLLASERLGKTQEKQQARLTAISNMAGSIV